MRISAAVVAICLFAAPAFAQGQAASGPQNPAVKDPNQNNASMPVRGKNSFTQSEAKSHIEAKGYTNVSQLQLDNQGVWHGTATKNGQSGPVTLDYQGNVN